MAPIDLKGMIDETKFFHGVALHGTLLVQHALSDLTSKDNSHALILRRGLWSAWVFLHVWHGYPRWYFGASYHLCTYNKECDVVL